MPRKKRRGDILQNIPTENSKKNTILTTTTDPKHCNRAGFGQPKLYLLNKCSRFQLQWVIMHLASLKKQIGYLLLFTPIKGCKQSRSRLI